MLRFIPFVVLTSIGTNRQKLGNIWGENADAEFEATDPDTDITHALYVENRYKSIGWQDGEKEPEQWQNFLQQITDVKISEIATNGLFDWFEDVPYLLGSVCVHGTSLWICQKGNTASEPTDSDNEYWQCSYSLNKEQYTDSVDAIDTQVTTHINQKGPDNPHEDNIEDIGGYNTEYIDNLFSADNQDSFNHHVQDMDNPHEVTCQQLNILPKDGGVFTGTVCFNGGLNIGSAFIGWI